MKIQFLLEFIGTAFLIFFGCSCSVFAYAFVGDVGIALSFAIVFVLWYCLTKMFYTCQLNPIISFACYYNKEMEFKQFMYNAIFQFLGSIVGALIVVVITLLTSNGLLELGNMLNGLYEYSALKTSIFGGIIFEIICSFLLVLAYCEFFFKAKWSKFGVLFFAISYFVLILIGIKVTGACYNPARAFGPALLYTCIGDFVPLLEFFVFLISTFLGGFIGAAVFKNVIQKKNNQNLERVNGHSDKQTTVNDKDKNGDNNISGSDGEDNVKQNVNSNIEEEKEKDIKVKNNIYLDIQHKAAKSNQINYNSYSNNSIFDNNSIENSSNKDAFSNDNNEKSSFAKNKENKKDTNKNKGLRIFNKFRK